MKIKLKVEVCLVLLLAVCVSVQAQPSKSDERALWDLWCTSTNSAFESSAVMDACKEFREKTPKNPLVVMVSGFEAWHYLKMGDSGAAVPILNSMLVQRSVTDIQRAGDTMARSWLTRLDRERVVLALKKIYLRDIEFPVSLEALKSLKSGSVPPLTDRWGKPWVYRLESSIKGMATQRYILESSVLSSRSYLKRACKVPYASRINLKPISMVKGGRKRVEFKTSGGQSVFRQAGDSSNRINLAWLGSNIMVLSDGNHWCVMPKPR